jgi:8-oxo-dGTP diphosphatase
LNVALPVKHSVAVMIIKENHILAIRRSESDDEFPGIWGLPAGTLHGSETVEDVIVRIGRDKLRVDLSPIRKIAAGTQIRATYRLEMALWEASMDGEPTYPEWQWAPVDLLRSGAAAGSLCCALGIQNKSRVSS